MRACSLALLFVICIVGLGIPVRAEEPATEEAEAEPQGWGRYGIGTMIHHRTTSDSSHPGMKPQQTVTEAKRTLVRVTDTHYVLAVEHTFGGRTQRSEEKIPKAAPPDALTRLIPFAGGSVKSRKVVGTESVTVAGTSYPCTKVELTFPSNPNARGSSCGGAGAADETFTTTIWEHAEHGILKMTSTGGWGMDLETTALDATFEIAGRRLACKASTLTQSGVVSKRLDSRDVPGEQVRSETTIDRGPLKSHVVTELVAFVAKPR